MRHIAFGLFLFLAAPLAGLQAQAAKSGAVTIGSTDSLWAPTLKENRKVIVYTPP